MEDRPHRPSPAPQEIVSNGPIEIISADEDSHTFTLNDAALEKILLRPDVCDRKVAVISVAGAFRKGKSFLLNFFLRFLQSNDRVADAWIGGEQEALEGFSWRGGSERDTSGILVWKEPFFVQLANGETIVVLLIDTQGAFDSQSTVKDCATIFALSTMVSSLQIYNLSQNIQEDDLQHLQLFTEYGRLALNEAEGKPFQSLLFLVRDWSFPYEAEYGFDGGQRILKRRLELNEKQHPELQQLRKHISSCFDRIQCFLLPHPGLKVATNPDFRGRLQDVEQEFKSQLRSLIPRLLRPEHLVLKEINGSKVTGRELLEYFRSYIKIFQGEELPEPKSMLLATAEANNLAAVANAKATYCRSMEEECGGDTPYMSSVDLEELHQRCRDEALRVFNGAKKMGGDEYSHQFITKMDEDIQESYENFIKVNNGKNLFKSAKTPAVLFTVLLIDYFIKEVFEFLYLDAIARLFSTFLGLILLTICLWAYSRYSGNLRDTGQTIDHIADSIWEYVIHPVSQKIALTGMKHATDLQHQMSRNETTRASNRTSGSTYESSPGGGGSGIWGTAGGGSGIWGTGGGAGADGPRSRKK